MALDNLPNNLKSMLGSLMEENQLQSWNIFGKNNLTQVTIRFTMATPYEHSVDTKYKKASHSQIERDRKRAEERKQSMISDVSHHTTMDMIRSSEKNRDIAHDLLPKISSATHEEEAGHGQISPATVNNIEHMHDMEPQGSGSGSDISSQVSSCGPDIDHTSENVNNNKHGKHVIIGVCNECEDSLRRGYRSFYKCTQCIDYDICVQCFTKGGHKQHRDQISLFDEPMDTEDGYCDGCGLQFRPGFEVYHCTSCDDYALCFKCKFAGYHRNHMQHFRKIPINKYLSIIK